MPATPKAEAESDAKVNCAALDWREKRNAHYDAPTFALEAATVGLSGVACDGE